MCVKPDSSVTTGTGVQGADRRPQTADRGARTGVAEDRAQMAGGFGASRQVQDRGCWGPTSLRLRPAVCGLPSAVCGPSVGQAKRQTPRISSRRLRACFPAAYEVSCRIRAGNPTGFRPDSPRTVASRHSTGSPVPRYRGLGWQVATKLGGVGESSAYRA